jgi:hypothetical protein
MTERKPAIPSDVSVGKVFGRLTVIGAASSKWPDGRARVQAACECGKEASVRVDALRNGNTKSCGCRRGYQTHRMTGTPTYRTWKNMLSRCLNPAHTSFPDYGGRGISVCEEWATSFEAFLRDMGVRPDGTTLDRINNAAGYEPSNCRWATLIQQARNRSVNVMVQINGETRCLAEWSELYSMPKKLVEHRVRRGWTPLDALTRPLGFSPRRSST